MAHYEAAQRYLNKVEQVGHLKMSFYAVGTVMSLELQHKFRAVHESSFMFAQLVIPWSDDLESYLGSTSLPGANRSYLPRKVFSIIFDYVSYSIRFRTYLSVVPT